MRCDGAVAHDDLEPACLARLGKAVLAVGRLGSLGYLGGSGQGNLDRFLGQLGESLGCLDGAELAGLGQAGLVGEAGQGGLRFRPLPTGPNRTPIRLVT